MSTSNEIQSALARQVASFNVDDLGTCVRNGMLNGLIAIGAFDPSDRIHMSLLEAVLDAGPSAQDCSADYEALARFEEGLRRQRPAIQEPAQRRSA